MAGELFHVIDTHGLDRPLLDELCTLTTRVRAIAHEPIPPASSLPAMDLLVAGFAIVGALLISFLR